MFCATGLVFGGTAGIGSCFHVFLLPDSFSKEPRVSGTVFIFFAPRLIFGGTEGVGSHFHVLCPRTHFWRYRERQLLFSCFARPYSFSAVPRASGTVFRLCSPGLIFGGKEGVMSRFHVLRSRTHFRRYRGRWVLLSYFARPDSFSAVQRVSGPVFMFCSSELVFDGTERVGSRFHVLRS
jgi:hypothetical protein